MSFSVPTEFPTSGTQYEPIPADNHIGVCIGVIDLGTHMESYQGAPAKPVRKIKLQFELPGVERSDGKAAVISSKFNYSLHEKATFRKTLDGWLGADWPTKYKGQSWKFLIGLPAMVNVESGPSKRDPGRVSSWVQSLGKFPKGMPAPKPSREPFWLSLADKVLPATLSAYDAAFIRESAEYQAGGFEDAAPSPQNQPTNPAARPPSPIPQPDRHVVIRSELSQYPADVQRLMVKHQLDPGYMTSDLDEKRDVVGIPEADYQRLRDESVPF